MAQKTKSLELFKDWTSFDLKNILGYDNNQNLPVMADWMAVEGEIPEDYRKFIEKLRLKLIEFYNVWNETELLSDFIAPFLVTIDFRGKGYNHFSERPMKAKIGKYTVKGFVDWVTATGDDEPLTPYFFIHEYKRMKGTESDPLGQLLIEMAAAQTLNENPDQPIYGCYVIGTYWRFVYLQGKTYAQSQGYDATDVAELRHIWLVLNKTKGIVAQLALEELERAED